MAILVLRTALVETHRQFIFDAVSHCRNVSIKKDDGSVGWIFESSRPAHDTAQLNVAIGEKY